MAFDRMTDVGTVRYTTGGLDCTRLLLDREINQQSLDKALVAIFENGWPRANCESYVDMLLEISADPNVCGGICLSIATQQDLILFSKLNTHGASARSIAFAMPSLFQSGLPEDDFIELVHQCMKGRDPQSVTDVVNRRSSSHSLVQLSITHYPHGHRILQTLLHYGFDIAWETTATLDEEMGEEAVNAVTFALVSKGGEDGSKSVDVEMIAMLLVDDFDDNLTFGLPKSRSQLKKKIGVIFTAPSSQVTALMVAASNNEIAIVDLFLKHGAEVYHKDWRNRTALFYASTNSNLSIARRLCAAKWRANDGSIHEAARELQPELVTSLIQAGHDPDYPSSLHQGRSAVLEMLCHARVANKIAPLQLQRTLQALQQAPIDLKIQYNGKNALYSALENPNP